MFITYLLRMNSEVIPMADPIKELADAEIVEIDEDGNIVPLGSKGRTGVRPPAHTFY